MVVLRCLIPYVLSPVAYLMTPWLILHMQMGPGVPVRLAIFIDGVDENETFGLSYSASDCRGYCYNATRR